MFAALAEEAVSVVAVISPYHSVQDSTEFLGSGRIVITAILTRDKLGVRPDCGMAGFGECDSSVLQPYLQGTD